MLTWPLPILTAIVSAVTALASASAALIVRSRKGILGSIIVAFLCIVLLIAPFTLEWLVARGINQPHVWFYDLRLPWLLAPGLVSILSVWSLIRREVDWFVRASFGLWAWAAFIGVFNTLNKCSPGWCGSYGFPFPFYSWSDAIVIIDGEWPKPFTPFALVFDALFFLAPFLVLIMRSRSRAA
jgi:hypothetical protein